MTHPDFFRRLLSRILIATTLTLSPFYAPHAQASPTILIGEIAWAGSSTSLADEWIELWNLGNEDASLAGLSLAGASTNLIFFPDEAVIPAHGTYLIANYAADDVKSALATSPQMVTTTVSLSNSTLSITLLDSNGTEIDRAGDGNTPPAGASGDIKTTMIRDGEFWISASSSLGFDEGYNDLGTPGVCDGCMEEPVEETVVEIPPVVEEGTTSTTPLPEESMTTSTEIVVEPEPTTSSTEATPIEVFADASSTPVTIDVATSTASTTTESVVQASSASQTTPPPSPSPRYDLIRLHELMPQPDGEPEWIELMTLDPTVAVSLTGVQIHDAVGNIHTFASGTLDGATLIVRIYLSSSRLNNDGDTVSVHDPNGNLLESFTYAASNKGEAVGPNVIMEEEPAPPQPNPEPEPEPELAEPEPILVPAEKPVPVPVPVKAAPKPKIPAPKPKAPTPKQTPTPKKTKAAPTSTKPAKAPPQPITIDMTQQDSNAGILVSLQGTVGSPPGLLTSHGFILLSPDGRGLLVRVPTSRKLPMMGDVITVNGTLIFSDAGVPSLKLNKNDTWTTVTGTTETASPRTVDLVAPATEDAWSLIQLSGTVRSVKGATVVLDLQDIDISISFRPVVGYRATRLAAGDTVSIRGLLDLTREEPRVLPRSPDDIVLVKHAAPKTEKTTPAALPGWTPFGAAGIAIAGTEGFKHMRQRRKQRALEKILQTGLNGPNE